MSRPEQKPKPIRVLADGRPVYRFAIGQTKATAKAYEVRPWNAGELADAESRAIAPYMEIVRKDPGALPPGFGQFMQIIACVIEPKGLTIEAIAKMGREHYNPLRNMIFKLMDLDEEENVFFPDADESGADSPHAVVPDDAQGGAKPPPKRVPILVRGDELAEGTTDESVRKILGARPRE